MEYDGKKMAYDNIGNPTTYKDINLSWTGRQLMTYGSNASYTYNTEGIRKSKTVNGSTTTFNLVGSTILSQTKGSQTLVFLYDGNGSLIGFKDLSTDKDYFYLKNLQGDIVKIIDSNKIVVATYQYDDWGKLTTSESSLTSIGQLNPFRYRGYYYDTESGLYYLNSRYYDPETGRFISQDRYISTGQGVAGYNMYSYCGNNPVIRIDDSGSCFYNIYGEWVHENWEYYGGYERKPEPATYIGTADGKNVYVGDTYDYLATGESVKVIDSRNSDDPDMQIRDSHKVAVPATMIEVVNLLLEYNSNNPVSPKWERTVDSMVFEWIGHNVAYWIHIKRGRTAHVDLNNNDEGKNTMDFIWDLGLKPLINSLLH